MKKLTYQPLWAILFIVLGLLNLFLGFESDRGMNMILGGIFILLGVLYLANPALVYSSEKIEIKNLFGMVMKSYTFEKDEVSINNGRIHVNGKKIAISPLMVNKKELNELIEFVSTNIDQSKVVKAFSDDELLDA